MEGKVSGRSVVKSWTRQATRRRELERNEDVTWLGSVMAVSWYGGAIRLVGLVPEAAAAFA